MPTSLSPLDLSLLEYARLPPDEAADVHVLKAAPRDGRPILLWLSPWETSTPDPVYPEVRDVTPIQRNMAVSLEAQHRDYQVVVVHTTLASPAHQASAPHDKSYAQTLQTIQALESTIVVAGGHDLEKLTAWIFQHLEPTRAPWFFLMSAVHPQGVLERLALKLHKAAFERVGVLVFGHDPHAPESLCHTLEADTLDKAKVKLWLRFQERVKHGTVEDLIPWLPYVDPSQQNSAALSWAALTGRNDMLEFLLPLSHPFDSKALLHATRKGHLEMVQRLLPLSNPEEYPDALCMAAAEGHAEVCAFLTAQTDPAVPLKALDLARSKGLWAAVPLLAPYVPRDGLDQALAEAGPDVDALFEFRGQLLAHDLVGELKKAPASAKPRF